jgi:hypothetical protein
MSLSLVLTDRQHDTRLIEARPSAESAQPTRDAAEWQLATPAEEALAERLRQEYPELWEAA